MFGLAHRWLCTKALDLIENISEKDKEIIINGSMAPDRDERSVGSHFGIYRPKKKIFTNWRQKRKYNAYDSLVNHFNTAVKEKNLDSLGRALHYVMDMMTIPHATGISDGRLRYMILFRPHRRYERYTLNNIDKYYKLEDYGLDFFNDEIFNLMYYNVAVIRPLKYKLVFWTKKRYDMANEIMIPRIIYYVKGFIERYLHMVEE